jgi:hypothetical protein
MNINRQTNDIVTFDHEGLGKFEVELNNATIVKLSFMANGLPEKGQLIGTDRKFLQAVHKSLGELLTFLDEGLGSIPPPVGAALKEDQSI